MQKKKTKSKEEKTAEDYFRVNRENLDRTTEKEITNVSLSDKKLTTKEHFEKEPEYLGTVEKEYRKKTPQELETVEVVGKKVAKKKYSRKKTSKKKTTKKKTTKKKSAKKKTSLKSVKQKYEYKIPKIDLKEDGYELVITEKPQAASKIAKALGDAKQEKIGGVYYYDLKREGKRIIVACAVGHLFTLKQTKPGSEVPIFEVQWIPNYVARKGDFTKKYYDLLLRLAKGAKSLTVATDYDVEGEVIGLNVVRLICGQKDAQRMKFSTLTNAELNNAYDNKFDSIDWGQATAGETRHYLDWFYGINLSRALMNAIKTTGRFKIMSIGRVQGPALKLIVDKEREIQDFVSEPFWQAFVTLDDGENKLELKHPKDIFNKEELEKFDDLVGKKAVVEIKKREQSLPPNPPFNLTNLQTEAYKFHGITPTRTLQVAQSLYLAGLISYPRTSSQKLPDSIDYKTILKKLAKDYGVEKLIKKNKPIEGKKTDPAHPSIYPTGEKQILSGDDEKIYNLIVRRFLSLFCEDAIIDRKNIKAKVEDLDFTTNGSSIRKKAWLEIYPSKLKENELPDLKSPSEVIDSKIEEKETLPPKRYSPASIVSELEKRNLGTKATRSSILETLYDRDYIREKSIAATELGMSLIKTLEKYSPIIIDEDLTRNFEKEMEEIASMKSDFEIKEKEVIEKAKKTITNIADDFVKHDKKIGAELMNANSEMIEQQKIDNKIVQCPKCKKGDLAINYARKFRRYFVACDAYPDCKNTYTLPPNGIIKKSGKVCEECSYPMLMRLAKGKRPWIFCFNPECPTNAEWAKKKSE